MELFDTFPLVKDIPKTIADIKQFYFDPHMMTDKNWVSVQLPKSSDYWKIVSI